MRAGDPGLENERMIEAARNAVAFVEGLSRQDFLADTLRQHAVAMGLVVIDESAKRVMRNHQDFAGKLGTVPWADGARMRDRIAPGYQSLSMPVVWDTVAQDLIPLLGTHEPILATLPSPDEQAPD